MMITCNNCLREFDESIAAGICPHCGNDLPEKANKTQAMFPQAEDETRETSISHTVPMFVDEEQSESMQQYEDPRWLPLGTILNSRYRVCKVIGSGGFGITYKVWDTQNSVYKAVKEYFQQGVVNRIPGQTEVLISAPKRREEFEYGKERLLNEARIVAKFQSTSIVRVDDYFEENNTAYMVMEYLEAKNLEEYIHERKSVLDADQAIRIGVHICEALEEIHRAGVLHRDIAPDNIHVTPESDVKIIDFGSARLSKEDVDDQMIAVKPGFAPPEQYERIDLNNDRQQAWTDIYALGATLYLCTTGQVPTESTNRKADFDTNTDRVRYPHEINPNIPEFLSNVIMTAMAINIHERFQNASEMKEALLQERKVLPVEVVRKRKQIRRTVGIGASIAVILVLAFTGMWRYFDRKEDATLREAAVSIWYCVSDEESLRQQKNETFEAMKQELNASDKFAEITVELTAIPERDYAIRLEEAYASGNMPQIFESPDRDAAWLSGAENLKSVIDSVEEDSCWFLRDYDSYFEDYARIPLGFNVPVIYINTVLVPDYSDDLYVDGMDDLMALSGGDLVYQPMVLNEDLKSSYEAMFSDFASYEEGMTGYTKENFLNGEAVVYFSDTSDYYTVRNRLQSNFAMIRIETEEIVCRFCDYWSISECDGDTETAAKEILAYFLTNNFQDQYYVQTNLSGLPIEKQAVQDYAWVTKSMEKFLTDINNYSFVKQ